MTRVLVARFLAVSLCAWVAVCAGCGKGDRGTSASAEARASEDAAPIAVLRPAADAAPRAVAARTRPAKSKPYRAALRRGRKAAQGGDHSAAVAAFQDALVAAPGDARALSELGWVAFKLGELDRAERATEASIAAAASPKLMAASLYNRGRIAEQRGDNQRAIEAYQRSLSLRDNDTVKARLTALGGSVRKALAPVALAGPFPSLGAACKSLAFFEPGWTCGAPIAEGPKRLLDPKPPFLDVRVIGENPAAAVDGESFDSCRIAIRTARGWYLGQRVTCEQYKWAKTRMQSLRWAGPDAADVAIVEWTVEHASGDRGFDRDGQRYMSWVSFRWRFYCGIGPSGAPSCTPVLPLSVGEEGDYAYSDVEPYELEATLSARGTLSVTAKSPTVEKAVRVFLGQRTLSFP